MSPKVGMARPELPQATSSIVGSTSFIALPVSRGQSAVLDRGLVPDLPGPVELVAEAPQRDGRAAPDSRCRTEDRDRDVPPGWLQYSTSSRASVDSARAEVQCEHRLDAGDRAPARELVRAERRFVSSRPPGEVEPDRAPLARADAVLPVVAGDEVAARIPHDGDAELAREREDVATEPVLVRGRMAGLVDARVDAAPEVLDERAEEAVVDARDSERRIDREPGPGHPLTAPERSPADGNTAWLSENWRTMKGCRGGTLCPSPQRSARTAACATAPAATARAVLPPLQPEAGRPADSR